MITPKITLILASLALALALAVTASAAGAATTGMDSAWCGGGQRGPHGPIGNGSGC